MTRFVPLVMLLAAGCGGGGVDVAGTVTYQGKPLSYGTVVLVGSDGLPKSGQVGPGGAFTVQGVPPGTAKVAVSSPRPPGMPDPARPEPGAKGRDADLLDGKTPRPEPPPAATAIIAGWTPIPDDYGDPLKSKLTVEIKAGEPVKIELK